MKIADSATSRTIDRIAAERYGISGLELMEKAGRGVAEAALREMGEGPARVVVFTGKGNNGGDGFVAARYLRSAGVAVRVVSLCRLDELSGDAAGNAARWAKEGGGTDEVVTAGALAAAAAEVEKADMVIDAVFGTGLAAAVSGHHAEAIKLINRLSKKTLSVDIPSGIDATTGAVLGEAVNADLTATMAMPKLGLMLFPGRAHAGRVEVVDIGVPREATEDPSIKWNLLGAEDMRRALKPRKADSHKGSFGHLFVLAGSPGMTGAAFMAGTSAMRAGAGLVTVGVPESLHDIMEMKTTEVMTVGLPETADRTFSRAAFDKIKGLLANKTALLMGPGAACSNELADLIGLILRETEVPLVIDADGLNSFAPRIASLKEAKAEVVLTPHPGEASRLLGVPVAEIQADRVGAAERLVGETGATVVLKGASTVIAHPSGQVFLNPTGNPGLATAGTGDILAGMLGAFLAQGCGALDAACAAAYIHGLAADEVKKDMGEAGMMATDLLARIPRLVNSLAGSWP